MTLALGVFMRVVAVLIQVSGARFASNFLKGASSYRVSMDHLSTFSPRLVVGMLYYRLISLRGVYSLFYFFSNFSKVLSLQGLCPYPVDRV